MLLRQREFSFCRTRTLAPTKVASHDQGELASIEDPFLLDRVALAAPPCGSDRLRRASPMTLLLPPSEAFVLGAAIDLKSSGNSRPAFDKRKMRKQLSVKSAPC